MLKPMMINAIYRDWYLRFSNTIDFPRYINVELTVTNGTAYKGTMITNLCSDK